MDASTVLANELERVAWLAYAGTDVVFSVSDDVEKGYRKNGRNQRYAMSLEARTYKKAWEDARTTLIKIIS